MKYSTTGTLFAEGGVAVPVPDNATTFGLPVPFDVIVRLPLRAPANGGLNASVIVQLPPPATTPQVLPTSGNSDTELDTMLEIEIGARARVADVDVRARRTAR